jgi:hypothetical protein
MKKTMLFVAVAALVGAASAFSPKVQSSGWYRVGTSDFNAPVDQGDCQLNLPQNCSITDDNAIVHTPVYDSQADINVAGKELKFRP